MTLLSRLPRAAVAARQSNGLAAPSLPDERVSTILAHQGAEEQAEKPVWRPAYEYSEWVTFGGISGTYRLNCPYDSPCEVALLALTASDQTTGTLSISDALTLGNATVYDPNGRTGWGVFPLWTAAATMIPMGDNWQPLPLHPQLVLALTVANSHAAWVTVQFRRRINAVGVPTYAER